MLHGAMETTMGGVAAFLLADSGFDRHMDDWGAGWWVLMALMMIVFWGLLVLGAVWIVRMLRDERRDDASASAIELLDRRLARGEISPEEYRQRRALIKGDDGASA